MTGQELSTEQIDKFFETGGEEAPVMETPQVVEQEGPIKEETSDPSGQSVAQAQEQAQIEEEKHARNYQAAMREERARRQEMQRQLEETRAQQARMEATFQKLVERMQQKPEQHVPSYDEDPLGYQQHKISELEDYVIKQNQYLQQVEQAKMMEAQKRAFVGQYMAHAQEFANTTPDFWDAYNYLVQNRRAAYMAGGLTQQEADYQIELEEAQVVSRAFKEGVNPAERAYAMAKASGYTKAQQNAMNSNASSHDRQIDMKALEEASKKLEELKRSQEVNKTLGTASSKSSVSTTLSNLSSLSEDEFEDFIKGDGWNKLMKAG